MARRYIHYEAAFEDYVRSQAWPYVPVDEKKKAIFAGARVKSFDFIVYPPGRRAWLVDVKGRKFPYEVNGSRRYWENWVTKDDLEGLKRWEGVFGDGFEPVLVFVYWLAGVSGIEPSPSVHQFRGQNYAFVFATAGEYAALARTRSPKWETLSVPLRSFREIIQPVGGGVLIAMVKEARRVMAMRRWLQTAASAGFFVASGGYVFAQTPGTVANEESSYLVWIVFAGATLIVCATGFMNPKHSHLG